MSEIQAGLWLRLLLPVSSRTVCSLQGHAGPPGPIGPPGPKGEKVRQQSSSAVHANQHCSALQRHHYSISTKAWPLEACTAWARVEMVVSHSKKKHVPVLVLKEGLAPAIFSTRFPTSPSSCVLELLPSALQPAGEVLKAELVPIAFAPRSSSLL